MNGRRLLGGAILAIALVLLLGRWTASLYADYRWYVSLGATEVWRAKVATTTALTLVSFAVAGGFAFLNLYAVRQSVVSLVLPRRIANIEIGEEVPGRYLMTLVIALSVAIGVALIFPPDRWPQALLARIGPPFGESETNLQIDLGFFVYWLPFESAVHSWAVIVVATVCIVVVLLYALTPSLKWERGTLYVSAYVRRHFTVLGAVVMLMLAWSYRLGMYRLLDTGTGAAGLFTAVDYRMQTAMLLLSVVTLCAAFVVAGAGWTGQMRLAFGAVSLVLLLSLLARTVAPLVLRRTVDPHDANSVDNSYFGTRLTYTRRAFAVDDEHLRIDSAAQFASALSTIPRTAIWDGATLLRAAERMRHVRTFGSGPAWTADASGIQAHIVERGSETSPEVRDVWGISRFDPSTADDRGQPVRVANGNADISIGEPAVFDSAPAYTVLPDSANQVVGVEMGTTPSRLMHAWSLQNFRLLFGQLPANNPVLVERRDVRERIAALAPFFEQGSEVVPLVANDTLYWVVELYSSSSTYPLSQRFNIIGEDRAYFQHAATAIVHAHSGSVRFYKSARPDPVATTWSEHFSGMFRPLASLPPGLRDVLPPITDQARAQALALAFADAQYLTTGPLQRRHLALPDGADSATAREPARAALPGMPGVSALWTLLDSTDHVSGVIAAPGGANRISAWIPLAHDVARWGAIVDRLRLADTSALHETAGMRAPLRVLPVNGHALYMQPSFLTRPGGAPTLSHVSVFLADTVHVAATLASALGAAPHGADAGALVSTDLRSRADSLYRLMRDALSRGDWLAFGKAFDALGVAIKGAPR